MQGKTIRIDELSPRAKKLYEGFLEATLKYRHYCRIRRKFRNALLHHLNKQSPQENLKVIDLEKKMITILVWHPKYNGFKAIMPLPFTCKQKQIHIERDMARTDIERIKENYPTNIEA